MPKLTEGKTYRTDFRRAGATGIVQVVYGNNDVHLFGSLDNENFVLIESYTSSSIREAALCTYFKFSTSATDPNVIDENNTTELILEETIGG